MRKLRDWMEGQSKRTAPASGAITLPEANRAVRRLAKKDTGFVDGTAEEWAAGVREATGKTCSVSTIHRTKLWDKVMSRTGRRRKRKGPKAVALTEAVLATVGKGKKDETLNRLIAQCEADSEPSPLEPDPPDEPRWARNRRMRHRKRL